MRILPALAAAAFAAAPSLALAQDDLVKSAKATVAGPDGTALGILSLAATPAGVLVWGPLRGLSPGPHGLHVHETGRCDPPFESAGGHLNPAGAEHGFMSEAGPHAGDMTNVTAAADGTATVELLVTRLALDRSLFDGDGAAIVVHALPDDYRSQPGGAAGDRIACGVVEPD